MERPSWLGKAIGGALGWFFLGPLGGLLGLFIGSIADSASRVRRMIGPAVEGVQSVFFRTTFRLMGRVAKSDGRISEQEIAVTEQLMRRIGLSAAHRQEAIALFRQGADEQFDVEAELDAFMASAGAYANLRQMLLLFLFSTASADGQMSQPEHDLLRQIAARIGFSAADYEQLLRMFAAQDQFAGGGAAAPAARPLSAAYAALGIDASCSDEDAKKAYRRLMSQYHPDKLIAEGMPQDMIRMATERTQEIQNAWEQVRKARGL